MNLGRNDPCWCGSGKKYKKCHLDRQRQARVHPFESERDLRKAFRQRTCLHPQAGPDCNGTIVRAHSVRRSADLAAIAVSGHVIHFSVDFKVLRRTRGRSAEAERIGINEASTFTGFCHGHDTATFRALEAEPFIGRPNQCFLLFYRAWVRETFQKQGHARSVEVMRETDRGRNFEQQLQTQDLVSMQEFGIQLGLRDTLFYKAMLDEALLSKDWGKVESRILRFANRLPLLCSGGFYPYNDFKGRTLQTFEPEGREDPIVLSILNEGDSGYAVFSWPKSASRASTAFVQSLLEETSASDAVARAAISNLENVYLSPAWWDGLSPEAKAEAQRRVMDNVSPVVETPPDYLSSSGVALLNVPLDTVLSQTGS